MTEPGSHLAALLQRALDIPPNARIGFIERACAGDAPLLARLLALLAIDAQPWDLLDRPIDALAAHVIGNDAGDSDATRSQVERRIGPYRLVRELGRGGMGSVWLADRADGQFAQRVALKLIKLGMDSAHVQAQFRRERAVLARLRHPNIAQLIDGGVDERGRPWFAMELVEGASMGGWLVQHQPDLRRRLRLFVKLCRAVAHAHQQLVVHRDLKPSNVMVQADDEPRLLDFGIAKLVEDDGTERTGTAQRFLSRDFAAPEQIRGDAVSTATDVYALGLLLFELLTGTRYRALHKSGDATVRPSAARSSATSTASTPIPRARLRGDLDAITVRALAEDPARRYAGAQALADDVQRHLDGKPVEARPDGFAYRGAKYVRRHRAAAAVAAIGVAAFVAASGVAFWQAHAKSLEAERARVALRQSETTRTFIESVFLSADPTQAKGAATTAGELLAAARARVPHDLGREPAIAADLLDQIGNTYVSLGEDRLARDTLRDALVYNAKAERPSLLVEASASGRLAYFDFVDGHRDTALVELDRLIARLRGHGPGVEAALSKLLQFKSSVLFAANDIDAALAASAQAADVLRPRASELAAEYLQALVGYADAAAGAGHGAPALEAADRALAQPLIDDANAPASKLLALGAKVRALQALHRDAGRTLADRGHRRPKRAVWRQLGAHALLALSACAIAAGAASARPGPAGGRCADRAAARRCRTADCAYRAHGDRRIHCARTQRSRRGRAGGRRGGARLRRRWQSTLLREGPRAACASVVISRLCAQARRCA